LTHITLFYQLKNGEVHKWHIVPLRMNSFSWIFLLS